MGLALSLSLYIYICIPGFRLMGEIGGLRYTVQGSEAASPGAEQSQASRFFGLWMVPT